MQAGLVIGEDLVKLSKVFRVFQVSYLRSDPQGQSSAYAGNIIQNADGKVGWIMLWALGIPIPVLFVLFLLRGCT